MPRQTEADAKSALGGLLQTMLPKSHVRSENMKAVAELPGSRPGIPITEPDRARVVLVAEYLAAPSVDPEGREWLGLEVAASGRILKAAIALRYPESVSEAHNLPGSFVQS
ncbi:MAG: hypothetical protein OXR64_12880 [Chloroflexota bacterium]|nr:hypothetical protein [Chloroflexota bacterium]